MKRIPGRTYLRAGAFLVSAGVAIVVAASPALAAFGAIAYDDGSGHRGWSFNYDTPRSAERKAMSECGPQCDIVLRFGPRECAAFAATEGGRGWGASARRSRSEARQAALENCQSRNPRSECRIRMTECNDRPD